MDVVAGELAARVVAIVADATDPKSAVAEVTRLLGETLRALAAPKDNGLKDSVEVMRAEMQAVGLNADMVVMNVRMVGAMISQIHHGISSVATSTDKSLGVADRARQGVELTGTRIQHLEGLASQIGSIVKVISDIASQTRMLALNAQIEAARAGEHGRGFGVVAEEVKTLARQSANAAEEIDSHIQGIRRATEEAASSMTTTHQGVVEIHQLVETIASAVTEQLSTTESVTSFIEDAAGTVDGISQSITQAFERMGESVNRAEDGGSLH